MRNTFKFKSASMSKQVKTQDSILPHKSEADLKSRRIVLKVDDKREKYWGNEVGKGDNN